MKNIDTNELFTNGMAEFVAGNLEKSIEHLTEAIDHDPKHRLALSARGSAYLKLDRTKEAVADFDRVVEAAPDHAKGFHLRGLAKDRLGDTSGALADFDSAISLQPDYGAAYFSRATLLTRIGEEDRAAEDMQMVTHLTQQNIESFANENNVWRSQHLRLESIMETDLGR